MDLTLRGIVKRYGDVLANDHVDLTVRAGEVVALLGENGAGKSTLMKIAFGFARPDSGQLLIDGRPVEFDSPKDAVRCGIGMVFQHLSLIDELTVAENLALAQPRSGWWLLPGRWGSGWRTRATQSLKRLAPEIDVDAKLGALSLAQKQAVELAKVLGQGAALVILDEPTSLLARHEAERLWRRIRQLADEGVGVVLITHKLDDVEACADRVCVMRQGRVMANDAAPNDRRRIVREMIGSELDKPRVERRRSPSNVRLRLQDVSARRGTEVVGPLDLQVRGGEVVGVAGVMGNGQELLGALLAGVVAPSGGVASVPSTVGYIPEHAATNGCGPSLSATQNLRALEARQLPFALRWASYHDGAARQMRSYDVRPPDPNLKAEAFSGGNLQKLVASRELGSQPQAVVACYPLMGLDVAAASALIERMLEAAQQGAAVVWISEDVDPLLEHADRIVVLHRGRLVGECPASTATREQLGYWMTGTLGSSDARVESAKLRAIDHAGSDFEAKLRGNPVS